MLSDTFTIALAIFFSIMLEIVRDGAIIALFNSKMNKLSRGLVIVIFLATTSYMFSSHYKAVIVIEESAVKYALEHQTQESKTATNPRYEVANNALKGLEQDLKNKELEKTPQLIENSNSIHAQKRADAMNRIDKIDAKIERLKSEIEAKNNEIIQYEDENKQETEDSQKIISSILLATLFLVESLAMLGAVIKFIYKDNAQKEIAKHSEIVEEYVNISEQMKRDNESLVKNLGQAIKTQSQSNQNIMGLVVGDLQQSSHQNIQFIQAVATLKNQMVAQMNEIVIQVAQSNQIAPTAISTQPMIKAHHEEHEEPTRKIGFNTTKDLKSIIMSSADENGKVIAKARLINLNDRSQCKAYSEAITELKTEKKIEYHNGHGYFLAQVEK